MNCECVFCKNNIPVTMPEAIIEAAKAGTLVLFCGAGISTENRNVLPDSFYTSIQKELNIKDDTMLFSELMQRYCDLPNGRRNLLKKIKARFEYIHSFPELEFNATTFHRELAELYFIKTIITTNWDTYFEDYCYATPITIPQDFVFWDEDERCVLKIHGSINNLSTIIATKNDYKGCKENLQKGIIGATLKTILANKTVIFIGFSFGDEDFAQILDYLRKEMKDVLPHIYIVTLNQNLSEKIVYRNSTTIVTDGTYFLHQLKLILKKEELIVNCDTMPEIEVLNEMLKEEHRAVSRIKYTEYPCVIYCLAYQDGVGHALDRFIQIYNRGDYNRPGKIADSVRAYQKIVQDCTKAKNYWDEAYYEGYLNGLLLIAACDNDRDMIDSFPFRYLPNSRSTLDSNDVFMQELNRVTKKNDKYHKYALNKTNQFKSSDIVFHHPPY